MLRGTTLVLTLWAGVFMAPNLYAMKDTVTNAVWELMPPPESYTEAYDRLDMALMIGEIFQEDCPEKASVYWLWVQSWLGANLAVEAALAENLSPARRELLEAMQANLAIMRESVPHACQMQALAQR